MSKKEEKYISNIMSGNQELIIETFEQIREEGNPTLLPYLFDLLNSSTDEDVKRQIYNVLCELKRTDAVPLLINAINDEKYAGIQEVLIRVCWENGLDYTSYLSTFVDIVINGNFMNAFEAFTVIENMEGTFPGEVIGKVVEQLNNSVETTTTEKKSLLSDLIRILQ